MLHWIDTHCHLDAPEFDVDRSQVRARARALGVSRCVLPGVHPDGFDALRQLAHAEGDAYALGIHPLYTRGLNTDALTGVFQALQHHQMDPYLVAVGEIGLDFFVPDLDPEWQEAVYVAQLRMALDFKLPVILHVRRSADRLLRALRALGSPGGIAHAFNGSEQQAHAFVDLGFKLGFGGAMSFERALQLRRLAQGLPLSALVLETDAPDIPPHWIYRTAAERVAGQPQGRNEPGELPRLAQMLAELRGMPLPALAAALWQNALEALPRLAALPSPPRIMREP